MSNLSNVPICNCPKKNPKKDKVLDLKNFDLTIDELGIRGKILFEKRECSCGGIYLYDPVRKETLPE